MTSPASVLLPEEQPGRRRFAPSLRMRLLSGLVVLAAVGLVVSAFVTHALLASFLDKRFDQQLNDSRPSVEFAFVNTLQSSEFGVTQPAAPRGRFGSATPTGTYAAAYASGGVLLAQLSLNKSQVWSKPDADDIPLLPHTLTVGHRYTVNDRSGARYRVTVEPMREAQGVTFVVAMPLRDVDDTLNRLWLLEGLVTAGVLVGVGLLAWVVVGFGLRPLRRMETSAGAIAAGDLSRRIEHPDARTEVGRLGLALNTMLARIEEAFAARAASEERLRRFLADASHELRTPLTSIRGYAELFRRGASHRPDDLAKAMRRIEDESARMSALVEELLLLARLDEGRPPEREPVLLADLAADARDDMVTSDPTRAVRLDADEDVVVNGDDMQLRQVIANLLANARVHTPPGTAVDVRVAGEGPVAVLEVTDHGSGLAPQDLPKVFDRFYRADLSRARDHGGAGLGLAIVASIVTSHGGRVGVSNAPGAGARFRVELPRMGYDEHDSEPSEAPERPSVTVPVDDGPRPAENPGMLSSAAAPKE
jgi:two-component system OmpR family sensor kinase